MTSLETIEKSLLVLSSNRSQENKVFRNAVDLLMRSLPQPVDVIHAQSYDEGLHAGYSCVVYAGLVEKLRQNLTAAAAVPQLEGDAYCCKAIEQSPTTLCLAGGNDRAVLYAAAELDRQVRLGADLSGIDLVKKPLVPLRLAYMCASTHIGRYFRPGLFDQSVEKLAHAGANGIFIMPEKEYGTSAGMEGLPFRFEDGKLVCVEQRIWEWQYMLDKIKSFGHEVYVLISAWIPPELTKEQVRNYYDGGEAIPDYEARAVETMNTMLSTMFERLPQIDGVVLHTLERTILWGGAVSIFPAKDSERAHRVTRTYLGAVRDCCAAYGKNPCFWPHAFGINTTQLLELREILAEYPDIINLEDSYWNNGGWPYLPIMGYLPDELRAKIHKQSRFGMFTTSTDNEGFGGGALPGLNPVKFHQASQEAARREAEVMVIRLNRVDRTAPGTINHICGINVEAALRALWTPTPDMDQIWDEWSRLRFGTAAASVAEALKRSRDILLKGYSCKTFPFMSHESTPAHNWVPGRSKFPVFGMPGIPLVQKSYSELRDADFQAWQLKTASLSIKDFRNDQEEARRAVDEGSALVAGEKDNLSEDDFAYLTTIYDNASRMLGAIRRIGEATYAMNLVADNFDNHSDPVGLAQEAIKQLGEYGEALLDEKGEDFFPAPYFMKTQWKGETISGPGLARSLVIIAEKYQVTLEEWVAKETAS